MPGTHAQQRVGTTPAEGLRYHHPATAAASSQLPLLGRCQRQQQHWLQPLHAGPGDVGSGRAHPHYLPSGHHPRPLMGPKQSTAAAAAAAGALVSLAQSAHRHLHPIRPHPVHSAGGVAGWMATLEAPPKKVQKLMMASAAAGVPAAQKTAEVHGRGVATAVAATAAVATAEAGQGFLRALAGSAPVHARPPALLALRAQGQ
eukprot:135668-Pelagomonas_calceolata.AAC.5